MNEQGESRKRKHLKKKAPKPLWQKIWNIATGVLVGLAALLAVALVGVRLFGFTPYSILSPSMTPQYRAGDLVYVWKTPPEDIREGDVITYVANEDLVLVTHRVEEIDRENSRIYTKGDANQSRDAAPVRYENVVGVVKFSLPKLGYVSSYLTSESGRYVGLAGLFGLLLLFLLPELFKKETKKPEEENPG